MTNVVQGDLAIIVGSTDGKADGGLVSVDRPYLHPKSVLPHWACTTKSSVRHCEPLPSAESAQYDTQPIPPGVQIVCADAILRPIRGENRERVESEASPAPRVPAAVEREDEREVHGAEVLT